MVFFFNLSLYIQKSNYLCLGMLYVLQRGTYVLLQKKSKYHDEEHTVRNEEQTTFQQENL